MPYHCCNNRNNRTNVVLNVSLHLSSHQSITKDSTSSATGGLFVDAALPDVLYSVGNNGDPSSAFPLGLCEGDCDSDSECQPGLKCLQRDGLEEIPGCSPAGEGSSGWDYCYNETLPTPTIDTTCIEWSVTVPSAGMYLLSWRYALDAAVRTTNVSDRGLDSVVDVL